MWKRKLEAVQANVRSHCAIKKRSAVEKKKHENLSHDSKDKFSLSQFKLHVAKLLENRINFSSWFISSKLLDVSAAHYCSRKRDP